MKITCQNSIYMLFCKSEGFEFNKVSSVKLLIVETTFLLILYRFSSKTSRGIEDRALVGNMNLAIGELKVSFL